LKGRSLRTYARRVVDARIGLTATAATVAVPLIVIGVVVTATEAHAARPRTSR
jgi:hypothetical protein